MHRVLVVYDQLSLPSTVVRGLQFRSLFDSSSEFHVKFVGRTSERMNRLMQKWPYRPALRAPALLVESRITRRREDRIIRQAADCDLVLVLTVPSWRLHERLCRLARPKVVMDLIDGLWLPWFRQFGWDHIHDMLQQSHTVICENEFTAEYVRKHNPRVTVIPDAPQIEVFDELRDTVTRDSEAVTIGWIGGPNTADALYSVFEPLEQLFQKHPHIRLRLVGASPDRLPRFEHVRFSVRPSYDQRSMASEVLGMDIGLFPLFHVEESLYRGTLKARIYMSGGAAVVAQDFGENQQLIRDGYNGCLADSRERWFDVLDNLIVDGRRRDRIAAAGLQTIRDRFTVKDMFERLQGCFRSVLE